MKTILLAGVLGGFCTPAFAQVAADGAAPTVGTSPAAASERYDATYFEGFAPQNAGDMVAQLPGFQIQGGEGGGRGFGQASLNILINGRRPSSKSSDAGEILGRIPAKTVQYIEILDGASLDIPGLSGRVANIVAIQGEISGAWRYAARFEEGTRPQIAEGGVNLSGKRGNLAFVGALNAGQFTFTDDGREQFFDGAGTLVQDRREDVGFTTERPSANVNLTWTRPNDDVANLNLSVEKRNNLSKVAETFTGLVPGAVTGASFISAGEDEVNYEIGADYLTGLDLIGNNGKIKLIALHRFENSDFADRFLTDDYATGTRSTAEFLRRDKEAEYIARGEYTFSTGTDMDWTASLEGAFNSLESDTAIIFDAGTPVPDSVRVEELRGQFTLSQSWAVSPALNLQTSLGAEYSELEVVSQTLPARGFFRPKGFVTASYTFNPEWSVQAEIERSVGQLDFGDFVTKVNLNEDRATEGNDDIVPEQVWAGRLTVQRQNAKGVSGSLKAFYDIIEDPVDTLLFADGTQGPGNLDAADFYGLEANLTWVADSLLPGLRISADGVAYESNITDPVTGNDRNISNRTRWAYDVEARYDVPNSNWAFEGEIESRRPGVRFRIDETLVNRFSAPEIELGVIHKDFFGMELQLVFQNLVPAGPIRRREIFGAPAGSSTASRLGPLVRREALRRTRGRRFGLILSDTF